MNIKNTYFILCSFAIVLSSLLSIMTHAEDRIDLETTIIKGNTELPQILYVVPWKENKAKASNQQKLVLHSLFGDLLDPQAPPPSNKLLSQNNEYKTP